MQPTALPPRFWQIVAHHAILVLACHYHLLAAADGLSLDVGHQRIELSKSYYDADSNAIANETRTMHMKWSKLKQQVEACFADSVRKRTAIHITRYGPGVSSTMTRGWLAWDGEEVLTFSTIAWLQAERAEADNPSTSDSPSTIHDQLQQRGLFSRFDLTNALETYLGLSIESALSSPNQLIRALAMFDRRLGKRRLQQLDIDETTHPFVKQLYDLRCRAEQLPVTGISPDD